MCTNILEGRVAIILNGSQYVLVVPAIFVDFIQTPEDMNLRFPYSNLLRIIRLVAFAVALLLPGIYLAMLCFHQELVPTELLLSIAQSREKVPFPFLLEVLIMEFAFELIREASLRVPR